MGQGVSVADEEAARGAAACAQSASWLGGNPTEIVRERKEQVWLLLLLLAWWCGD